MNTEQLSYYLNQTSFWIVIGMWVVLARQLIARRKAGTDKHASHERRSWLGFALQILSFPIVGAFLRMPMFSPLFAGQYALNVAIQLFAIVLIVISVLFEIYAFKELGKQWSLQARVLEGHQLIKTGAYSIVRHPIYTGLLGRLLATGITYSRWYAIVIAAAVFVVGTKIRTISEERLLKAAFGQEFVDYAAKVPPLIPFVKF